MRYDNTNDRVVEGKRCIGKVIGGSRKSILEPNIKTRVGAVAKKHGREGSKAHNS